MSRPTCLDDTWTKGKSLKGMHDAVSVDVVDKGEVETPWGTKRKIQIVWEIGEQMEDGRPFTVRKSYTASLHEQSTLYYKDLTGWRGRSFSPAELTRFDLEVIIGTPCRVVVQHVERDGVVFANVTAVMKADPGSKLEPSGKYVRVVDRKGRDEAA